MSTQCLAYSRRRRHAVTQGEEWNCSDGVTRMDAASVTGLSSTTAKPKVVAGGFRSSTLHFIAVQRYSTVRVISESLSVPWASVQRRTPTLSAASSCRADRGRLPRMHCWHRWSRRSSLVSPGAVMARCREHFGRTARFSAGGRGWSGKTIEAGLIMREPAVRFQWLHCGGPAGFATQWVSQRCTHFSVVSPTARPARWPVAGLSGVDESEELLALESGRSPA